MELNSIAHQRNILATLGIDVWVQRGTSTAQAYDYPIYRDRVDSQVAMPVMLQPLTENLGQSSAPSTQSAQDLQAQAGQNLAPSTAADRAMLEALKQRQASTGSQQQSVAPSQSETQRNVTGRDVVGQDVVGQVQQDVELPVALHLEPFELQAYVFDQCVVVLESSSLTPDQAVLWGNIQAAKHGQYYELNWPFPLPEFQDGRGAMQYIQGFLDGLAQERSIVSLGELPHAAHPRLIVLASLQQMLEQPILKRRLWQFMQNRDLNKDMLDP
ncbi:hypothetical protein EC844_13222 [Acinetobacter calcoaceticus]|uniref:Uncharacterized protein n=1 Tax=Acinetobacter calcoaceticus TaxID=471 RepID=A0A4R1XG93_ACICA|nr:hypothetical protein EC844_13222 [Acinetobacter calcoaceticus]